VLPTIAAVCAWASLRQDLFGAVVDVRSLAELATPLVRLAGRLLGEVVGATEITVVPSVSITHPNRVQLGREPLALAGDESAVLSAIVPGPVDVANELAAHAVHALESDRSNFA
jgi:hypothetical protein